MNKPNNRQLFEDYIGKNMPKQYSFDGKLFVVGFIGVIGSGKTTIAQHLADLTGLCTVSNDKIRRFLMDEGFEWGPEVQDTVQYIAESATKHLLGHNISHIVDADLLKFYDYARNRVQNLGARLYLVDVVCPEDIIRERIVKRSKDAANDSLAGIEDYERRKVLHLELSKPDCDFAVYTDRSIDSQVSYIINQLQVDGYLGGTI